MYYIYTLATLTLTCTPPDTSRLFPLPAFSLLPLLVSRHVPLSQVHLPPPTSCQPSCPCLVGSWSWARCLVCCHQRQSLRAVSLRSLTGYWWSLSKRWSRCWGTCERGMRYCYWGTCERDMGYCYWGACEVWGIVIEIPVKEVWGVVIEVPVRHEVQLLIEVPAKYKALKL